MPAGVDYGLDAPVWLAGYFSGAALLISSAGLLSAAGRSRWLAGALGAIGCLSLLAGLLLIWSSRSGKLDERDRLLDELLLSGNESLLDVGCGHGLLLVGAAHRLPTGRAVGVDIWSQVDQLGNQPAATLRNARLEGVSDRVAVLGADGRWLPFRESAFDVVVAGWLIHNLPRRGREAALNEMVRVLKPGGRLALMDLIHVRYCARVLRLAGMQEVTVSGRSFWGTRTVSALKPAAA